jgi:DNA-binding transcriptional ArsR family regulator
MNARESGMTATALLFASLGDPVRLAIVARLCAEGPLPTVRLQQTANVSRQAVTKHLRLLEDTGIVNSDRVGRDRLWRIEARQLQRVRAYLERISSQWDTALARLRALVEDDLQQARGAHPRQATTRHRRRT